MIWRGMNEDALRLLSQQSIAAYTPDEAVQALAIESVSLAHLQRFPEAEQKLAQSQKLCTGRNDSACTGVLRAAGILCLERGDFAGARTRSFRH